MPRPRRHFFLRGVAPFSILTFIFLQRYTHESHLSGACTPDRFVVHEGQIYLFASDSCRNSLKLVPEMHTVNDKIDPKLFVKPD